MQIKLLFISPDSEGSCEYGARICYDSNDKITETSREKFLPNLLKSGHTSVFEHSSASFHIQEISRAASHQIVRHRHSSFSQRSQRYVNEQDFNFVTPSRITENPEAHELYKKVMNDINHYYHQLIELGIKKEDARFIMPNAAETELVMTANFREWLHVIDMRVSRGAQWEIRKLTTLIWKELYNHAPNIFGMTYFENWSKDSEFKKQIFEEQIVL
ncbi:MAG: FAD-dependent thymidylate synthase [Brevinema sp.]